MTSNRPTFVTRFGSLVLLSSAFGVAAGGCSDDKKATTTSPVEDGGSGGECKGGPVTGAADTHCGATKQEVGQCVTGEVDAGAYGGDAGAEEEAAVVYGTEADDDDCKYHVVIDVPPLCDGKQAVIKLTLTSKTTGKPVTGAGPELETTLGTAAGPIADEPTEKGNGVYEIPAVFDKPGRWVGKFHFFEECSDTPPDAPHGHVSFYFDIP